MDQLTLGQADKEEGARAALDAKEVWGRVARKWIQNQEPGTTFTSDDLIEDIGTPVELEINANNAVGAVFLTSYNKRLITSVGRVPSRRRSNHGRYITEWLRE